MERKHNEPREREMRGKSSSITIVEDMVRKRVRKGIYLYLERQSEPFLHECQVSKSSKKRRSQGERCTIRVLGMDK